MGESGEHRQMLSRDVFAPCPVGADRVCRERVMPEEGCWRLWHFLPVPYPGDVGLVGGFPMPIF